MKLISNHINHLAGFDWRKSLWEKKWMNEQSRDRNVKRKNLSALNYSQLSWLLSRLISAFYCLQLELEKWPRGLGAQQRALGVAERILKSKSWRSHRGSGLTRSNNNNNNNTCGTQELLISLLNGGDLNCVLNDITSNFQEAELIYQPHVSGHSCCSQIKITWISLHSVSCTDRLDS